MQQLDQILPFSLVLLFLQHKMTQLHRCQNILELMNLLQQNTFKRMKLAKAAMYQVSSKYTKPKVFVVNMKLPLWKKQTKHRESIKQILIENTIVTEKSVLQSDLEFNEDFSEEEDYISEEDYMNEYEGWEEAFEMFGKFVTILSNTLHEAIDPADEVELRRQARE